MTEPRRGSESAIGAKEGDAPSAHPEAQTREGQRISLPFLRLGIGLRRYPCVSPTS